MSEVETTEEVTVSGELLKKLEEIAMELSEKWSWFSTDFEFGSVEFTFTSKASDLDKDDDEDEEIEDNLTVKIEENT